MKIEVWYEAEAKRRVTVAKDRRNVMKRDLSQGKWSAEVVKSDLAFDKHCI